MGLEYSADTSTASWIEKSETPWAQLVSFGPATFEAHARLRMMPDPDRLTQAESDVEHEYPDELALTHAALQILRSFTSTLDEWYFCVWDGWGDAQPPKTVLRGPLVVVPNRQFALIRGGAEDFDDWATFFDGSEPRAALVWPADRQWCFAYDVDPHWAGIGGSSEAIQALMESDLDVVSADPKKEQPTYY